MRPARSWSSLDVKLRKIRYITLLGVGNNYEHKAQHKHFKKKAVENERIQHCTWGTKHPNQVLGVPAGVDIHAFYPRLCKPFNERRQRRQMF